MTEKTEKTAAGRCRSAPSLSPDIDAGWAWVIAGAALAASAISSAVYYTFSMYFPLLLNEFQATRSTTAWVGSLNNGVYMLAGPIATIFIKRIGCRWTVMLGGILSMIGFALSSIAPSLIMLFFTHGGITAFGLCLNYTSWIVAISDSFVKKHAIAFSLSQSGVGLGVFVFGPLFNFLIDLYGWRGAFLITGACTFQLTCLGALIFPPREPAKNENVDFESFPLNANDKQGEKEEKRYSDVIESQVTVDDYIDGTQQLKRTDYSAWLLHLSSFFWLLATSIPYILLADYTRSLDLEEYYIVMLSTMGVGDLVGRLVIGPLVTFWNLDVTKIYAVSQVFCAILIASFPLVVNGIQMIIQGFLFSVSYGLQCLLLALVPRSLFGTLNLSRVFGITMFFGGLGILIGPPIAGLIVDSTPGRSYWLAFVFATVIQFLAAASTIGCYVLRRTKR
ncbi:monocarboxylate transporter 12-like [Daphnia pulicaria]|uniref:monocarboxylate transporter 12-like n=1 Tax=Daphnia pulicaria TaxID=35523 RepID=UPI001EEC2F2E|nr:monocarboxylate transporter 12-like [Daphnia pulicaria]